MYDKRQEYDRQNIRKTHLPYEGEGFCFETQNKKYKLLSLFVAMVFCRMPAVVLAAEEGGVVKITNS